MYNYYESVAIVMLVLESVSIVSVLVGLGLYLLRVMSLELFYHRIVGC
jgi:hypothetical protein